MNPALLLVVLMPLRATAQAPNGSVLARTTLSTHEGTPTRTIKALCYDDCGFLMVGTTGGLSRYDGDRFETFLAADHPGLDGDRILALHLDAAGRVWIGADMAAASIYEDDRFRRIRDAQALHTIRQFHQSKDGAMWLVGSQLGRFHNDMLEVFGEAQGIHPARVRHVTDDAEGVLWLATDSGVFRRDTSGFHRFDERPSTWVTTDFEGYVWSQTENGDLIPLSGPPAESLALGDVRIHGESSREGWPRLLATTAGVYSMSPTENGGTRLRVEPAAFTPGKRGVLQSITCLLPGLGQDVWVGTNLLGLQYIESRYVELIDLSAASPGHPVSYVHPLPGGVALVASDELGVAFAFDAQGARTPITVLDEKDFRTTGVVTTAAGTWLATGGGLARLVENTIVPDARWRGRAKCITATADGAVWLKFEDRIQQVVAPTGATSELASFPIPSSGVTAMCACHGSLVVVSREQLLRLDPTSGEWAPIAEIGHANVRQLRSGPEGEIWLSTYGQGLWRLRPSGRVDQWSRGAGLPDPFLAWIAPIDASGDLWVNSNTGLLRISIASLDAYAAGETSAIDVQSFLAPEANSARGAALSDGSFALPTLEGIALFDRAAVPPPGAPPHVQICGPQVNGVPIDTASSFHGRVNLQYTFTAPIFPRASRSSFQYRMVEFNERWTDAGPAREVRFPSLPSGDYTLEVRARTPTSTWSKPVRSMTLWVPPFWYDRIWVRWLLACAVIIGLLRVIHLRTRALTRRNNLLTEEMAQRKGAEARLGASERRFRRLFHTAPSAILSWTPSGVLLDRNERADELFAWGHDEVVDSQPWELFEDAVLGRDAVHRAFVECEDLSVVAKTRVGDFQAKRCRWQFAPTRAESGEVTSIIAMISDLSRQDRDAKTLADLRESLVRAEESERSRIARELHDDLSQRLAALAIEAHMVDLDRQSNAPQANRSTLSFRSEIENVATHLHTLSRQLHPTIVDDLGLMSALRSECSRRNQTDGAPITLTVAPAVEEPPKETALALFRIAQEAIRNASRHADATAIQVNLEVDGDWLELTVRDDGRGIGPGDTIGEGGIGMNSMRERARLAGGDLFVQSDRGSGTSVKARVPRYAEARRRALTLRGD